MPLHSGLRCSHLPFFDRTMRVTAMHTPQALPSLPMRRAVYGMLLEAMGETRSHAQAMGVSFALDPDCPDADLHGDIDLLLEQLTDFLVRAAVLALRGGTIGLRWRVDAECLTVSAIGGADVHHASMAIRFAHQAAPVAAPLPRGALRVLMVEDDFTLAAQIRTALEQCGVHDIVIDTGGMRAMEDVAAHGRVDIVVADMRMAGMDGIELMRRAARDHGCRFLLVASLDTGLLATAESVVRASGVPLLGILNMPMAHEKLAAMLTAAAMAPGAPQPRWSREQLVNALVLGQFIPYFQPKCDLASGQVEGVEIVARWRHPQQGMLEADQFLDALEQNGLVERYTEALFLQAVACIHMWRQAGVKLNLAMPVSPMTMSKVDLPNRLRVLVARYDVVPAAVTLELGEAAIARMPLVMRASIARLRAHGFGVAIDDVGAGYAAVLKLGEMPFSELKIDCALIAGAAAGKAALPTLEAIMDMSARMGMRTVAKGVDSKAGADFLAALGCSGGQGGYFAQPMAAEQLLPWIRSRSARSS